MSVQSIDRNAALASGLVIAALAAYWFGVESPARAKRASLRAEIAAADIEMASLPARLAALKQQDVDAEAINVFLTSHGDVMTNGRDAGAFSRVVSALIRSHRLSNLRLEPLAVRDAATHETQPYSLRFRGDLRDVTAFFGDLETEFAGLETRSIDLVPAKVTGQRGLVEVSAVLESYAWKPEFDDFADYSASASKPAVDRP